jgi:hypothetical protein
VNAPAPRLLAAAAFLAAALLCPAAQEGALLLAENGKALVPIVVSDKASDATKAAAAELAVSLKRVTGAAFEVKAGDGSKGIVVGTLAEFPVPALEKPLEVRGFDGKEAFAIRTEAARLLLLGATDLGVPHAVARFLENLGWRRFFPAPEWEVVPSVPRLAVKQDEASRPVILARNIAYGFGPMRDPGHPEEIARFREDFDAWKRMNRMAGSFHVRAGHSWKSIIDENKAEFEKHPEYYALVNGVRRKGGKFEVANPAVRKMVLDHVLGRFRKNPEFDMVSVEPADGGNHSESEESKKLGTFSDQVFGLANEVARGIQKEFPGKMVGLLAYGWHSDPPAFDLDPHVYVQITAGFIHSKLPDEERLALWAKKCRNLGFYEYWSVWTWDRDRLPGGRAADVPYLQRTIRDYAARGATSVNAESSNSWGPHGRGYYVASRLLWDPQADVAALLDDFYQKAFGPAAPAMRRYYERLDRGGKALFSKDLLARAFRDVEEASALAKDRPDVLARLDHVKQYLRYVHLDWMLDRAKGKEARKPLALAILTHGWRTRFSYMTHWEAFRQMGTEQAAKEFDEPTWDSANPSPNKPWRVDKPMTREETEAQFREGLAFFQSQPVSEKSFSNDLVPVRLGNAPAAAEPPPDQGFQSPARYALYSLVGEPLRAEITTGLLPVFRDMQDPRYVLTDAAGAEIAKGVAPIGPPDKHPLELKVPKPGLYFLEITKSGAGFRIAFPAGQPASLVLSREDLFRPLGATTDLWFYVPKGTKQLQYYWRGGPHQVEGPDGKTLLKTDLDAEFITVPVPPGMDGKAWCLSRGRARQLVFFNAPNFLGASPAALLVPRELVRADGLEICRGRP